MADPPKAPRYVPVFTPGLGVRMVEASEAPAAIDGGARFASEGEYRGAKLDARYGGVGGTVSAAGYGALRGFGSMFGAPTDALMLSGASTDPRRYKTDDPFRGQITETEGERWREKLGTLQELHPTASFVGEAAGIAGATALGGGLVGRAGAAARTVLGEGALGALGAGAAEGAIYSAGARANEAAVADEDITAQKLLAAAGHGALFGAGANALLAGAGRGLSSFRSLAEDGAGSLRAPRMAEAEAGSFRERIGEGLQKGADVKTIRALGGSAGDIRTLERNVEGGYRRVAQDIRTDIEASTGQSIGRHTRESLHEYATTRLEELNAQRTEMIAKLDKNKVGIAPDAKRFLSQVREELVTPNLVRTATGEVITAPGSKPIVHAIEDFLGQVEAASGGKAPSFSDWNKWRIALDKTIKYEAANVSPAQGALRQMRAIMEKEFETSGEVAAKQMGTTFASQYQATKSLMQSVIKAQELTERGVSRELVNNSIGLRATMGALSGFASGNPLLGIAGGVAGKIVQDRGDVLAADLLSRAADIIGVRKIVARTDARVAQGVAKLLGAPAGQVATPAAGKGFFSQILDGAASTAARTAVAGARDNRKAFNQRMEQIATYQSNPALLSRQVGNALGPLTGASPKIAASAVGITMAGLSFLASKMPPTRQDPFTLQPQFQPVSRASDSEMARHTRYVEALDNPTIVLDEARKGTLSRDHVEAVKAVYPKLYAEMQQQVMRSLVESKSELPYGRRIQLGILLDIPTDKTLSPDFLTAIQATYSSAESAGAESPPPSPAPLQIASSLETGIQSAMSGGLGR